MTFYLSDDDVRLLYDAHINAGPLIKPDLLSSSVYAPQAEMFGVAAHQTLFDQAAALLRSLAENQPYQDDNKRIAWLAMIVFLEANGYVFQFSTGDAVELMVAIATKSIGLPEIANRVEAHCKRR